MKRSHKTSFGQHVDPTHTHTREVYIHFHYFSHQLK